MKKKKTTIKVNLQWSVVNQSFCWFLTWGDGAPLPFSLIEPKWNSHKHYTSAASARAAAHEAIEFIKNAEIIY